MRAEPHSDLGRFIEGLSQYGEHKGDVRVVQLNENGEERHWVLVVLPSMIPHNVNGLLRRDHGEWRDRVIQLDGIVQHTTLRPDGFGHALRLLVRRAVDELRNRVDERLQVPVRVEVDLIRQETGNDLDPTKLEVALLFPLHGIVQLVFMKVEDLRTHTHTESTPSSPSATRGERKSARTAKRYSLRRRYRRPPRIAFL